jgi:hypothetical protein
MFVTAQGERVLLPQQRKSVRPLLLHGDDHYRCSVSGHAPTVPHCTVQQDGSPPCYVGEVREYLNTISQVGGLVERRPKHGHLIFRILCPWILVTITNPGKPQCVLIHFDSPKHCTCHLNTFL